MKYLSSLMLAWSMVAFGAGQISDPQITKVVEQANKADIKAAMLAKAKSKNKAVREFAGHMIKDHSKNNIETMALNTKMKVRPAKSSLSQELEKEANTTMAKLKKLKGEAFDRAYIDSQVTAHQKVIDEFDRLLLPEAQNPELKALLEKTKPVIVHHLEQAKNIQSSINK
jgi:putative membrane protein